MQIKLLKYWREKIKFKFLKILDFTFHKDENFKQTRNDLSIVEGLKNKISNNISKDKFFEDVSKKISSKTKVLFLSHITSPTGLVFPIKDIIDFAKERKIITIVDGAHVPGHIDLHLHTLDCDFYTGAIHKWMCGPKGVSFLFVKKEHQKWIKPVIYSWGKDGDDPEPSEFLQDFQWQGTRDMSAFLTIPKVINFFKKRYRKFSRT